MITQHPSSSEERERVTELLAGPMDPRRPRNGGSSWSSCDTMRILGRLGSRSVCSTFCVWFFGGIHSQRREWLHVDGKNADVLVRFGSRLSTDVPSTSFRLQVRNGIIIRHMGLNSIRSTNSSAIPVHSFVHILQRIAIVPSPVLREQLRKRLAIHQIPSLH